MLNPEKLPQYRVTFADDCSCTISQEQMAAHIAVNIKRQIPQARIYDPRPETVALVCGGPTLAETEHELIEAVWSGAKICAVNGAYKWLIDRNLRPSAFVMLDGREFNANFVNPSVVGCKYLLASQCHPRAFELCEGREVVIWHAVSGGNPELEVINKHYLGRVHPITGGTTVAIRAIMLMRMLGFVSFDIFGLDSCLLDGQHHAYEQPENDVDSVHEVWLRPQGRDDLAQKFFCSPWMMKQAYDIQQLMQSHGDNFRLHVRGRGLIAAMLRTGAEIETKSQRHT